MKRIVVFLALIPIFLLAFVVVAQSGNRYDLTWNTVDGGDYSLGGTIGQHDANLLTGGDYTLRSGFWDGGAVGHKTYLPLVLQND